MRLRPEWGLFVYLYPMAQRRMFSPAIVESDAFLDMPISTQALYFHLGMFADDDGFVNPKKIMRMLGVSDDDLKVLITKRFILPFETGVVVIKHWLIHNMIRKDRYKETMYLAEKNGLAIKDNGSYTELDTSRQPNGNQRVPQVRLGKVRLEKETYGVCENVKLTEEEHEKLITRYGRSAIRKLIDDLSTYQKSSGKTYKDHYAALLNWASRKGLVEERPVLEAPKATAEKPISAEERAKIEERKKQIAAKFTRHKLEA